MKIILKIYKTKRLGNLTSFVIDIPSNKITVNTLKKIIYSQFKIKPSSQRLTYQIYNEIIIMLTNDFPLNYFHISDYSTIYLENLENYKTTKINRSPITMKYMNKLGYFSKDSKKCHSSEDLLNIDVKNSSHNSDPGKKYINLSDNELDYKKGSKNNDMDDDSDLELVLGDEKDEKIENTENNIIVDSNEFQLEYLCEKFIKLIKKKDFNKIKYFFKENNMVIKNDQDIEGKQDIDKNSIKPKDNNKSKININSEEDKKPKEKNFCEILDKNGWNGIHYISYYGYYEILDYMLNNLNTKLDLNIPNKEGYTPLLLSAYKQHIKCIELLLSNNNINVNYLGPGGSALHIACKKNNMKMVSLLLLKSDVFLLDKEEKIALEYAINQNIKILISKVIYNKLKNIKNKKSEEYENLSDFIEEYKHLLIKQKDTTTPLYTSDKYTFLKKIAKFPIKPPFVYGHLEKAGRVFRFYRKRYVEINPVKGVINRYKKKEDYPKSPNETIFLRDIIECDKIPMSFKEGNEFCFTLSFQGKNHSEPFEEKYMAHNAQVYEKWVEMINRSVNFVKFWDKVKIKFEDERQQVDEYLNQIKFDIMHLDSETGDIKLYDINGKLKKVDQILINDKEEEEENEDDSFNNNNIFNIDVDSNNNAHNFSDNTNSEILIEDATIKHGITFKSFEILSLLGIGSFGRVCKVRMKKTGKIYAMKILNKNFLIKNKYLKHAITECNILKKSSSPFIITLHYAFQTPDNLYMILDYCPGGDLDIHIQSRIFEEEEAKFYIAELILAIEYLHIHNILYRDLKPENILIYSDGHIKLADFGLARENVQEKITKSFCGTPSYLSPEMIKKRESTKASDIYGIGAVLYEMLSGHTPFYGNNLITLYTNITQKKLMFPEYFSDRAKSLLKKLLEKNPEKRIDLEEIKKHKFFKGIDWNEIELKNTKPPRDLNEMKENFFGENVTENNINYQNGDIMKLLNDMDYNEKNKFKKRIANFTFIKEDYFV